MSARVPVVAGLFTEDGGDARLLGGHCPSCGAWYFPKQWSFCRNPHCSGVTLDDGELSTRGRLWSWTDNRYRRRRPTRPATRSSPTASPRSSSPTSR